MTSVSRRTFLGTAAAASVSAVAAPAMAASTSGNNLPAKWDDTVDVVVLGCGGAGMMAACQAHDAGGKVAVYDAGQSPFHTATNLCAGLFTAWGSKMQNADPEGRKDSWQQFAEDIMAYGNYMSLKEPVYCFAKNSGKAFDFLEDAGLAKHHLEPYAGHSRLRAHRQDSFKGRDYIEVLVKQLDKRGIKINHGMGVTKFYYDPATNTVVGVQVGEGDKAKNVKANKGVIMATGGITGTPQSLDRWVPSVAGKGVAIGGPKNDGTAMMVAVRDVGVPLSHMQYIASYPCGIVVNGRNGPYCRWWFITNNGGILVNKNGQRFITEKEGICHVTMFAPVNIDGTNYVDGGLMMNLPVSTLRRVCDKVVAVNVSPIMAQDYKMNIVSIAMRSFHFMFRANTFPEREKCDLLIEPYNLYGYSNTELEKAEEIFEQGYNTANGVLNQLLVEKGKILEVMLLIEVVNIRNVKIYSI